MQSALGDSKLQSSLSIFLFVLLWIGVLSTSLVETASCTQGSDDPWVASLLLLSISLLALVLLAVLPTNHLSKPLTVPFIGLVPWALYVAGKYTYGVTMQALHPCTVLKGELGFSEQAFDSWLMYWGPVQLVFLTALSVYLIHNWSALKKLPGHNRQY